jgi:hypothetical protein
LVHGFGGAANPFALLLRPGGPKVLVVLQTSMLPAVCSELVSSSMAFAHEVGIGFREAAGKEYRRFDMVPIAAGQERFEAALGAWHPITVDGEVELFCSGLLVLMHQEYLPFPAFVSDGCRLSHAAVAAIILS